MELLKNKVFKETIEIKNSNKKFKGCKFFGKVILSDSACIFKNCIFDSIEDTAISVENSSICNIVDSCISKNGTNEFLGSQIFALDSFLEINNTTIRDGSNAHGIEIYDSKLKIENSKILSNTACGINITNSYMEIKDSKIHKNGSANAEFSQIRLENSKCRMKHLIITSGIKSKGVNLTKKSEAFIDGSFISNNKKNGIAIERNSYLFLKECKIYNNGRNGEQSIQIWVDSSKVEVEKCMIKNGYYGLYAQKSSILSIVDCIIEKNAGGVFVFENSTLFIRNSRILKNLSKVKFWIEDSKVEMRGSVVISD